MSTTDETQSIYLMGICGTGMGALAGLLKSQGHSVTGSDEHVYPPMSTKLAEWGIPILKGYDPAHLQPAPSLVVVGNVIRANNPEALYATAQGIPIISMPEAIRRYGIGSKHSIVIAGTHGKTTTSSLAAHLLASAHRDPSFLVGGALGNYPESFRHGSGDFFVIEGDEYDTAYFDKGPKFLHYQPTTAVITSLEFDHADIFASIEAVEQAFSRFITTVPENGNLVVWQGASRARKLIEDAGRANDATVFSVAPMPDSNLWLKDFSSGPTGLCFEPVWDGVSLGTLRVPLWGACNAQNVLAAIAAVKAAELTPDELRTGLESYAGVKRRMEVIGEPAGITIVDDFGHHPTAVSLTLEAARTRWPGRRLWAVFEPRSATSRRNIFHAEYLDALSGASAVVIGSHERLQEIAIEERFDPSRLAAELTQGGTDAIALSSTGAIVEHFQAHATRGDVIIIFSNGDFGGLHGLLLEAWNGQEKSA